MKKFILFLLLTSVVYCQPADTIKNKSEKNKKVEIELTDGNSFVGYITSRDSSFIYFKSIGGIEQKIPAAMVIEIKTVKGDLVDGEYWIEDPNSSRLFLGPTARPIGNGKGYFSAYEIFFPIIGFGITNYISLAGGISLLPTADEQLFYITAKATPYRTKGFDASAGIHYMNLLGSSDDDDPGYAILFTAFTYGDNNNALTIGGGFDLIPGEQYVYTYYPAPPQYEKYNNYYFTLGGEARISSVCKLISENYLFVSEGIEDNVFLFSGGLRFFGKHIAGDFGITTTPELLDWGGFPFVPWLGFAYNW
jgi:hypothetical protein